MCSVTILKGHVKILFIQENGSRPQFNLCKVCYSVHVDSNSALHLIKLHNSLYCSVMEWAF